jgi:uncharacterized protein with GYD domain
LDVPRSFLTAALMPSAGAISGDRFFPFLTSVTLHMPRTGSCRTAGRSDLMRNQTEDHMLFICMINWTEQGIRAVKDSPKRSKAAKELAKKLGVEIKEVYLTSGDSDLLIILEAANGDAVAKFAMAIGALGSVRTRTFRAWTEPEYQKLIAELP